MKKLQCSFKLRHCFQVTYYETNNLSVVKCHLICLSHYSFLFFTFKINRFFDSASIKLLPWWNWYPYCMACVSVYRRPATTLHYTTLHRRDLKRIVNTRQQLLFLHSRLGLDIKAALTHLLDLSEITEMSYPDPNAHPCPACLFSPWLNPLVLETWEPLPIKGAQLLLRANWTGLEGLVQSTSNRIISNLIGIKVNLESKSVANSNQHMKCD